MIKNWFYMKKYFLLSMISLAAIGCVSQSTHDSVLKQCDSLMTVLESEREVIKSLEDRVKSLSDSVVMYSYPANQRYDYIVDLVKGEKFEEAYVEIDNLKKIFPKSSEAQKVAAQITLIEKRKAEIKAEEERRKALGFKVFKDQSVVTAVKKSGDQVKYTFSNFHYDREFTFEYIADIEEYYYRTADKGNTYLQADLSIYTKANYASTPSVYVCKIVDGKLSRIAYFSCEYARFETYGAYLGNYSETSHDFSKVNTVRYKMGAQISIKDSRLPLVVLMGKNDDSVTVEGMTVEDVNEKCEVIRILNRNRL